MSDHDENQGFKMTPSQEEIALHQQRKKKSPTGSYTKKNRVQAGASNTWSTRLLFVLTLVVALCALGWSALLQQEARALQQQNNHYASRIQQLENQLNVTDQGVHESTQTVQAQVKTLDSEIRKLWDNVWKKSKTQLTAHEVQLAQQAKTLSALQQRVSNENNEASQSMAVAMANKQQLTQLNDQLKAINAQLRLLEDKATETEGWIDAINGFRRQTNDSIVTLQRQLRETNNTQ